MKNCPLPSRNFNIYRVILLVLFSFYLVRALPAAQIKGIVKDIDKNPFPSIMVLVKNTGKATFTNPEGKFQIGVPGSMKHVVLVFQRQGYLSEERLVRVDDQLKIFEIHFTEQFSLRHDISVTAMSWEKNILTVPMAEHSVADLEIREKIPENIVETLSDTPGVSFIGSGGFSVTPSVRGLARRRVLVLVDGNRITSDRRAGTSPFIVLPELAGRIEVVRSGSSVLYGSDALGGVINILTRAGTDINKRKPGKYDLNFTFNSVNKWLNGGITSHQDWGKWHLYSGFQFARADDYASPDETILHSGYTHYSGILDISFKDEKKEFYLGYVGGFGKDEGKPDRENDPDKYTVVPWESDQMIRFGFKEKNWIKKGTLDVSLFLNPTTYTLEKIDNFKSSLVRTDTRGVNLGIKTTLRKSFRESFSLQAGAEWFSRRDIRMENENVDLTGNETQTTLPLGNGSRNDYGVFLTFDYTGIPRFEIDGGIRYTFFSISAEVNDNSRYMEKSTGAPSFFLGVTRKITSSMALFLNVGRAFRFPSLGESFYTGLTGRKYVIGNPYLEAESSMNIDTGLKIASRKLYLGFYLFANFIDHMIERYKNPDNIYTYDNIDRGKIYGGEIEARFAPTDDIDLFGHYFYYIGKSDETDDSLNDLPAPRFLLGGKVDLVNKRLWVEINYLHSFKKTNPGPAEVENGVYNVLDIKSGYYFTGGFMVYLKIANLFNERYYPNPDPDIPLAKGFGISAGIHFNF